MTMPTPPPDSFQSPWGTPPPEPYQNPWGATTPPTPPKRSGNKAVAIVAIVVAGIVALAIVGHSSNKTAAPKPARATTDTTDDTFDAGTVDVGTTTPDTPDISWASTVESDVNSVQAVLTSISTDATAGNLAATMSDCQSGASQMSDWQTDAASITVATIRTPYVEALSEFSQGFSLCSAGSFADATPHITAGGTDIGEATDAIHALTAGG